MARSLARDHGARLVLLHVAPIAVVGDPSFVLPIDLRLYRRELVKMRDRLEGPDLSQPVTVQLREGDAAAEILQEAVEAGADLIVMGSHGRTGLGHLLLGSVAEAVLRRAPCPVLTVKNPPARPANRAEVPTSVATASMTTQ
jgi:universal stress protein A